MNICAVENSAMETNKINTHTFQLRIKAAGNK